MSTLLLSLLAPAVAGTLAAVPPSPAPAPETPADAAADTPADAGPVLTLAEVIALADERNTDLTSLREQLEQANAGLRQAWATLLPNASLVGSYTRNSTEARLVMPDFTAGFTTTPEGGFNFNRFIEAEIQPTDQWAAVAQIDVPLIVVPAWLGVASAGDAVDLSEHTLAQGRADLLFATAQAYYAAATAQGLVEVAKQQLGAAQEAERVAKVRYELGETTKVAFLAASVDRAAAEGEVIRAENAAASARLAVRTLAGIEGPFRLAPVPEVTAPEGSADDLVRTALAERRDLAAARTGVDIASRAVRSAFWQFAPVVSATGQYRWSNVGGFTGEETTWLVGVTAAWTIFNGGGRLAAISSAYSQERQAEARREGLRRQIVEETERALLDLESARANAMKAREQAALARENAALAAVQFEAGTATYIDVTQANARSFAADQAAVIESFNVYTASLRLSRAIGALQPAGLR
jgi:outer membrane protein TolC